MSAATEELPHSQSTDMGALFTKLIAKRWWIVGSVLVFAGIFAYVAFSMKPVYRAAVVLASANSERGTDLVGFASSPLGGLASGLGLGPKDAETEEALAVLRSREFTESFILRHNLMPLLFAAKWDVARGTWKAQIKNPPTPSKAYKYFDKTIRSIQQDKKTGLTSIEIDWTDRFAAAEWANELVGQLNDEMRARAIAKSEASTRFLDKEVQTTATVEARDAISRLMEAQVKQRMIANVAHDYSFRVVDKALPADADDPIKPQKAVMILEGAILGLVVAGIGILLLDAFRTGRTG